LQQPAEEYLFHYEKDFDELWVDFGRLTLEGSLGEKINDRRKKKNIKPLWENRDGQNSQMDAPK
jgi:hypothetical protein